jgi:acetamidase/formamidase
MHDLPATAPTCHWGFFDAALKPALTIASGERVRIAAVSGGPEIAPPPGVAPLPELADIHAHSERTVGGHILTGPVAVKGARPGSTLEVRILDVKLRQSWGYTVIKPLAGTLPDEFDEACFAHTLLDAERSIGRPPWGGEVPLAPFFGVMGVAPPPHWGRITSIVPRAHGGNIDNRELVAGTTLYLPVFVEGALFSCGDGHAAQGDGEVCITAIETALEGTFEFVVRDDLKLAFPRAETPTHFITMGMDPDLDVCARMALRDMIALLGEQAGLSRQHAYMLCSMAGDLRVTQTVNGSKGVHMMMAKSVVRSIRA